MGNIGNPRFFAALCLAFCLAGLIALLCPSCASSNKPPEDEVVGDVSSSRSASASLKDDRGDSLVFGVIAHADKLVADMEAGLVPKNVNVLYDAMGARPDVDVTDPELIVAIYRDLAEIELEDETQASLTDAYHHVVFTLQDGSLVGFFFEGEEILCGEGCNYRIDDGDDLWDLIRDLQEREMGDR